MNRIKDFFYTLLATVIGSIVVSIAVLLAIASLVQTPLYSLLVAAFFVPFNYADLRLAFIERRWIDLAIRSLTLIAISAFIFGLIRFASGYGTFEWYFGWILLATLPCFFMVGLIYGIATLFFPANAQFSRLKTKVADFLAGARVARF